MSSSSMMAFKFVDVKTNKEYHLKPGKQLIASKNYSGPEDVDLTLTCDDSVAPFLVELSIKKQSARLTCLAGNCVAKSIGIGPGGTLKLRNGAAVEFGEIDCLEMQFIIQQDEGQTHEIGEVGQTKRVRRKLPETPGIPAEPPPKPARKHSANNQLPPPKPLRTKSKSASAIITAPYSEVAEIKRKISREVNMRKDLEEGSLKGSNAEISAKVANSICYQMMLQPNGSDLITSKLIDTINSATKIMEQHMLPQMEEFLVTYKNYLGIHATPECLLPADAPVIKYLLDTMIRSPSMQEGTKEVFSVCVEVLVILCASSQNSTTLIKYKGVGTLMALMRTSVLQFCFELQCNCWKLLAIMMDTVVDKGCDEAGDRTATVMEVSCDHARQQLLNFNNNCPLACAITSYLVSAMTFCSNSNDSNLTSFFTKLQDGDILQIVMSVATNVKQNEQFKQLYSKLASLLAPDYDSQSAGIIVSELETSIGYIPIAAHDSFKKDLDNYVSNSLKASISTSVVEASSMPKNAASPPSLSEQLTNSSGHRSLSKSKSDSLILSNTRVEDEEPPKSTHGRRESKVKEHFFKFMSVAEQQEEAKVIADQQEQTTDTVHQKEQTKLSADMAGQQETSADTLNQQEQGFADINDQEKQTISSADISDKQEDLPIDLIDQQEEDRSSAETTDRVKPSARRQMDMSGRYMKHTLKRHTSTETGNSRRQSWSSDVTDLSHMPGTIKEFSKEQASIEEMMVAHEDVVAVLTTRMEAINTLVPLWRNGKSLQAAINAEASCLNDDDTDMILFSDLLSLFKRYKSGWTLAVSLVFLRYFKQLLQDLSDPKYLQVIHDAVKMILERFTDIILSCKQSTTKNIKLSAQVDRHQKEMCYDELQEIQEIITKKLAGKTLMDTSDGITEEAMEHYRKLQKILEPFSQALN